MNVIIYAKSIKFEQSTVQLFQYGAKTLKVIVEPEDTSEPIIWETSDDSIAPVADGLVTCIKNGHVTITATIGAHKDQCIVSIGIPELVDMGLSVLWAGKNLNTPTSAFSGDYYAWGEIEPYCEDAIYYDTNADRVPEYTPQSWKTGNENGYDWGSYRWANGSKDSITKYCSANRSDCWGGSGYPDKKTILDPEDDVVNVQMGGKWRLPTVAEYEELIENCEWIFDYTAMDDRGTKIKGLRARSLINGRSIVFPYSGYFRGTSLQNVINCYLTSNLSVDDPSAEKCFYFTDTQGGIGTLHRCCGGAVRPVVEL